MGTPGHPNIVDRKRGPQPPLPPLRRHIVVRRKNIAISTKCGHWYWNGCHLVQLLAIWYGISPFGTDPVGLVQRQIFWYFMKYSTAMSHHTFAPG